jgi:hypothetical protein
MSDLIKFGVRSVAYCGKHYDLKRDQFWGGRTSMTFEAALEYLTCLNKEFPQWCSIIEALPSSRGLNE